MAKRSREGNREGKKKAKENERAKGKTRRRKGGNEGGRVEMHLKSKVFFMRLFYQLGFHWQQTPPSVHLDRQCILGLLGPKQTEDYMFRAWAEEESSK